MPENYVYVTTIGRKTGLPRQIEIWFVEFDNAIYILAEHGYNAQWVKNILANPAVKIHLGGQEWAATARVLDPEKDSQPFTRARELSRQKNGWGDGLPIEMKRQGERLLVPASEAGHDL